MTKLRSLISALLMVAMVSLVPQAAVAEVYTPAQTASGSEITIHVDGKNVDCDVAPILQNNRVFLPMRAAAEAMGASVHWENQDRSISVVKGDTTAYFVVGNNTYYNNNVAKYSDVAPMIVQSRTLLPIRVFAESLGASVYWDGTARDVQITTDGTGTTTPTFSLSQVPAYSGKAYVAINGNTPYFTASELTTTAYESYAPLDSLGRCGVTIACVGTEIMPTEDRGSIGMVKPTGWHTVRYDGVVDGNYLYNRCHLIGYQLTGENANERNLITGTRYLNIEGMLPFENMVADYVKETGNHVMYRSTPIFSGNELLARGVLMEGYSVEDNGAGISFCVFAYNVQPGIGINYADGSSWLEGGGTTEPSEPSTPSTPSTPSDPVTPPEATGNYILNNNTYKFHYPSCSAVKRMKNPISYTGTRDSLISKGYDPCKICNP